MDENKSLREKFIEFVESSDLSRTFKDKTIENFEKIEGLALCKINPEYSVIEDDAIEDTEISTGLTTAQLEEIVEHTVAVINGIKPLKPEFEVLVTKLNQGRKVMPNADCYFCVIKKYTVSTPIGIVQNPFGVCQKCHSFACGSHGARMSYGAFKCLICDTSLASTSSAALAKESKTEQSSASTIIQRDEELKRKIIEELLFSYNHKTDLLVSNLDEFIEHTSRANQEKLRNFHEKYKFRWNDEDEYQRQLHRIIETFPPDAKDLLFASILLVQDTEPELQKLYPDILLEIANSLTILENPGVAVDEY
jgi:hypothetical protein